MRTTRLQQLFATVLTIVALMAAQTAWAGITYSVESSTSIINGVNTATFTISRTATNGAYLYEQRVNYRTVNLTAYAGQHYEPRIGELVFLEGETSHTVEVPERTPNSTFSYQNGTSRQYRFEVLERGGFHIDINSVNYVLCIIDKLP